MVDKKTYSIIDMVVLGILNKEPMNAYKLAQFVEEHQVTRLVKLSTPAIYKSCKRLFEQGHLSGEVRRDGEAPEKRMYRVSKVGHEHFRELMTHFAGTITPFYFDINSVVYSLESLDYEEGLELIDAYAAEIKAIQSWLIPHSQEGKGKATFAGRLIVKQYLMVVDVLVKWVKILREEFIKEHR
ncbi:MAG: PadR family transcriptional regulator [Deltaproteobacteria bacterium]|nr:PadR family transcriptional regulator [Deltaproteobacteria bacterium]